MRGAACTPTRCARTTGCGGRRAVAAGVARRGRPRAGSDLLIAPATTVDAGDAVDHAVMQLGDDGEAVAGQSFDVPELPERLPAVEWLRHDPPGQALELARSPRRRQRGSGAVVVEIRSDPSSTHTVGRGQRQVFWGKRASSTGVLLRPRRQTRGMSRAPAVRPVTAAASGRRSRRMCTFVVSLEAENASAWRTRARCDLVEQTSVATAPLARLTCRKPVRSRRCATIDRLIAEPPSPSAAAITRVPGWRS